MRKVIFLIIPIIFSNCISTRPDQQREKRRPFNPAEYAFVKINGDAEINGKILVPQRDGEEIPCSGCEITLNPATSYSEEFYIKTVKNSIPIEIFGGRAADVRAPLTRKRGGPANVDSRPAVRSTTRHLRGYRDNRRLCHRRSARMVPGRYPGRRRDPDLDQSPQTPRAGHRKQARVTPPRTGGGRHGWRG